MEVAGKFVGLAIGVVIAIAVVPTVADTITGTNTTSWSTITGGAGAKAILELILLAFVAGIVIYIIKEVLG
jgi:hypothetical protein